MDIEMLQFNQNGLMPVVTQDYKTKEVLMLAYANKEAVQKTLETKKAHYYSRSRQRLWLKGETSGHFQQVLKVCFDCDRDALLYVVIQEGAACHTGNFSCFFEGEKLADFEEKDLGVLYEVYDIILDRKIHPKEKSYTNYLFDKGIDKMLKKVGEESAEVIIAAKNKAKDEIAWEAADLMYHLSVVLAETGVSWDDVCKELRKRQ